MHLGRGDGPNSSRISGGIGVHRPQPEVATTGPGNPLEDLVTGHGHRVLLGSNNSQIGALSSHL
eukprot:4615555-Alexandrium_andersonii.AAC.1